MDPAAVGVNNLVDDGKTETRAILEPRLKRLKDLLQLRGRESHTRIRQNHSDVRTAADLDFRR